MRAHKSLNIDLATQLHTALTTQAATVAGTPAELALRGLARTAERVLMQDVTTRRGTRAQSLLEERKDQISVRVLAALTNAANDLRLARLDGADVLDDLLDLLAQADDARRRRALPVTLEDYQALQDAADTAVAQARTTMADRNLVIDLTRTAA